MITADLTIYAGCILNEPVRWSSEATVVPVLCGAQRWRAMPEQLTRRMDGAGWVYDNGPMSIDNAYWADLSCINTILRLTEDCPDATLIGNAQYRRSWQEDALAPSNVCTLYVPSPAEFNCSLEQQFRGGHGGLPGYEMTMEAASAGLFPLSADQLDKVWQQNIFHGCLMARGPKVLYHPFMNMLLHDFCVPLWNRYEDQFKQQQGYNQRGIAFIAERLFTAMVFYRDFLSLGPIETAPIVFHDK